MSLRRRYRFWRAKRWYRRNQRATIYTGVDGVKLYTTITWPALKQYMKCPAHWCPQPALPLYAIVQHLNDHHKWSREEIADWLETLDLNLKARHGQRPSTVERVNATIFFE